MIRQSKQRSPVADKPRRGSFVGAVVVGAITFASSQAAHAVDYVSVATAATLYDAPSVKAKARFVIARDTPVEQVVVVGAWVKVRDSAGDLLWIEKSLLSPKRTVMVRGERAHVRQEADDQAALVFEAERDVVLDFVEMSQGSAGWVKVKHRSGQTGYVKSKEVWGS
jgi:SH3-like domain-containing protein